MYTNCADSNKNASSKPNVINVGISEFMLTPLSCACIINEVIKCLVYQKCQIPYPYNWLKAMVNKKRSQDESDTEQKSKIRNFTVSNHYRQASVTYDTLTELMRALITEFTEEGAIIEEVAIAFGTVAQCPQQLYNITVPELSSSHVDKNHIDDCIKHQHKVLRKIFMSECWMESTDEKLNTVNMYVYLKKRQQTSELSLDSATEDDCFFLPTKPIDFHLVRKQLTIHVDYDYTKFLDMKCCKFQVFSDTDQCSRQIMKDCTENKDQGPTCSQWFGSKSPVKGFKDCFINKVSASQLW